jgi:hypothetical protein
MKMIKRTLIAIAVVALLATSVHAALSEHYFNEDKSYSIKVDGSENFRWPVEYKYLTICSIPIKMHVGMYVQIENCKDKKILLQQVNCSDISRGDNDFPCYLGCTTLKVRANFPVKMDADREKVGNGIKDWDDYYDGGNTVDGDGNYHEVKVCVKAWNTSIWKASPGDEVEVGKLHIRVKPNM